VFAGAWFVAQNVNSRAPFDLGSAQPQSGVWRSPPLPADITGIDRAALAAQAITPIIVLPFTTPSPSGSRDEIIADAITADLTTSLSRFPLFRIISGGTASGYRGRAVDASALGRELGVRYIVEGDVRTEGNTTRVNVKLIDAVTRLQVWADRFERDEAGRFEIQDEITSRLARELQVGTIRALGTGSSESTSREPEINELIAKGTTAQLRGPAAENIREALGYFEQALERDPDSAPALLGIATQMVMGSIHYLVDPKPSLDRAARALTRAEAFSPDWAYLHYIRGTMFKALNQPEDALREQFRALELNPSLAPAYAQIASVLMAGPHPTDAPPYLQYALRLGPKDPVMGIWTLIGGTMEIELGHDDEALRWLSRSRELIPNSPNVYRVLAAAYALKGDAEHTAENVARFNALANPAAARRMVEGVRRRMDHDLNTANKASRMVEGLSQAFLSH
jgi:TolB-like protein